MLVTREKVCVRPASYALDRLVPNIDSKPIDARLRLLAAQRFDALEERCVVTMALLMLSEGQAKYTTKYSECKTQISKRTITASK